MSEHIVRKIPVNTSYRYYNLAKEISYDGIFVFSPKTNTNFSFSENIIHGRILFETEIQEFSAQQYEKSR